MVIAKFAVGRETLGLAVPPFTQHAISVSLPTWKDNVGYEEGEKRVVDSMVSGYPRFFIHPSIQKLANICEQKFGVKGEKNLLCASKKIADQCRTFIVSRAALAATPAHIRLVQYVICPEDHSSQTRQRAELHIVFFPANLSPIAKQFWQHTGLGISSRFAEYCLFLLPGQDKQSPHSPPGSPTLPRSPSNKYYSVKLPTAWIPSGDVSHLSNAIMSPDILHKDQSTYLEERYGRNLPLRAAAFAKRALRRRIAGVLVRDNMQDGPQGPCAGTQDVEIGPSSRGVQDVSEDDVFLFPTGMAAIWNAHQLCLRARPPAKCVCFGFPYIDTLKILEKWGQGVYFFGHGLGSDIDTLEGLLEQESAIDPTKPPILALFTEFPSNPLLRSPEIHRLRALANKYDFLVVVDDTVGNFVNVEVVPYADIVVTSLSKVFSGDANAMGGSLVLNPEGRHYVALKSHMATYEDTYFDEDALFMERNSRDFTQRVRAIDDNAQAICAFLRSRSTAEGAPSAVIKEVFYPKYTTPINYLRCKLPQGGYGGLFSLTFTSLAASEAFFDALPCQKGPSLGTNFTLACPYTILAHYTELDWAAQYGIEEGLVRISVGMEEKDLLLHSFNLALKAAEASAK
ncbi:pyridoxal phosphate-dependent transferase [Boletus edulis BED1]|uniref:Pyridoxal phosphate-dependent transferase n=1 Tax=Boletus edulis BED1 TaxID=1328754 RepID=A0AAD4GD12_BOLED|nr:pyridoxal phosphate-dependent transferase [Boletus edulis BED1]